MTQQKQGTATVGFKSLTVRILDGNQTPTEGENLFIIQGKKGEGATQTAKISGLAVDPTKTFGSNIAYHVNNRGVGDVKVDLGLLNQTLQMVVELTTDSTKEICQWMRLILTRSKIKLMSLLLQMYHLLQAQALMSKLRTSTAQCTLVAMKQKSRN